MKARNGNNGAEKDANNDNEKDEVSYFGLYRYADVRGKLMMAVGVLAATGHGLCWKLLFIFFGPLAMQFVDYGRYQQCGLAYQQCLDANLTTLNESSWNATIQPGLDTFEENTVQLVYRFVLIAVAMFVLGFIQVSTWNHQATRQAKIIRLAFFRSLLRQDISFHDVSSPGELNARLSSDIQIVKAGIGEKASIVIQQFSSSFCGVIIAMIASWRLTLIGLAITPILAVAQTLTIKISGIYARRELAAYAKAGSISEEALAAIRTVAAFGCQENEVKRYVGHLDEAKKVAVKRGFAPGFCLGVVYCTMYLIYASTFWYGTVLILDGTLTFANMTTCFFCLVSSSYAFGQAGSQLKSCTDAKYAGAKIFEIIDRTPEIDVFSEEGKEPNSKNALIRFHGVDFAYPTRAEIKVLKGVDFTVESGKTTALVGESGSGKSTIIQLIQRFYNVTEGRITVGGIDLKELNVKKHRDLIGVVAQEPNLFATTIAENIRWGREGVKEQEIQEAARKANAYDFIMKLPQKFDTLVGEGGGQMSGGQKQRIAIARAIARNPKILLLDEATSALDTESEAVVQAALEKASEGRTTVVIAHRLSTIRNADKIIAFQDGEVREQGSHDELLRIPDGVYSNLINLQTVDRSGPVHSTNSKAISDDIDLSNKIPEHKGSMRRCARHRQSGGSLHRQGSLKYISKLAHSLSRHSSMRSRKSFMDEGSVCKSVDLKEDNVGDSTKFSFIRLMRMNKPEWAYVAGGCLFAALAGSVDPLVALIYGEIFRIFSLNSREEQNHLAMICGLSFIGLGVLGLISYFLAAYMFAKSGTELTTRLREQTFRAILRQDIAFFDESSNNTGTLVSRLSNDASRVQGCSGERLGLAVRTISTVGTGFAIGFVYGWQLALLVIAFFPLLVLGSLIEVKILSRSEDDKTNAEQESGGIAEDALNNIRTVASLTREKSLYDLYAAKLRTSNRKRIFKSLVVGLGYGFSQCTLFCSFAAAFRLGIELVITNQMTFDSVFRVFNAIVFGAFLTGQNMSNAPEYAEAKTSVCRIFSLLNLKPKIDSYGTDGKIPAHCKGEISIKDLRFCYPCRPEAAVLKGINIRVKPGQTLALVGESGCGKSTLVQLLERFFDPDQGQVTLDGVDIRHLNISWLRQQIGIVSQEPTLFNQSIKDNILHGDCARNPSQMEVEKAAKKADIHDVISRLPNGYDTNVGAKGSQLSGGQKQRVAIARALLRNPKILLLDEATSALDTESEKIVQQALDAAREGRTSIVIAHRLSTVRNADQIAVIDSGVVVELGTHEELIATKGAYFSLVNAQLFSEKETTNNGSVTKGQTGAELLQPS
ncbi:ATP-dependent translocase ABCB1-like [Clavelina lepadiformis]|uniref:Uncharacterized protein n=1 Tax=Clavelina lepadiformis TaxID=159417 RepID=A0ABP0FXQ6_CLALP